MRVQIWFVLWTALVGIGCCEGAESDNIFGVNYEDKMSLSELEQKLSENSSEMEAKTVARYLAQATPKDKKAGLIGYLTVNNLLKLAEIDTENPLETCERGQFFDLIRMCDPFPPHGNVHTVKHHLSKYCNHCIKKRFEFCSSQIGKSKELTDKKRLFGAEIMKAFKEFSAWIDHDGDKNASERDNIVNYGKAKLRQASQFAKLCSTWNDILVEHLLFFDKDGKKTSAYFAKDIEAALLMERCRIFEEEAENKRERRAKFTRL